jgi:hypothetical protein
LFLFDLLDQFFSGFDLRSEDLRRKTNQNENISKALQKFSPDADQPVLNFLTLRNAAMAPPKAPVPSKKPTAAGEKKLRALC